MTSASLSLPSCATVARVFDTSSTLRAWRLAGYAIATAAPSRWAESLNGADSRAVPVKTLFVLPRPGRICFSEPPRPPGAFVRRGSSNPSRQAARAYGISSVAALPAVFRAHETPPVMPACTAPKPRPKPCGRAPSSLKARRLRKADSFTQEGKPWQLKSSLTPTPQGSAPHPGGLTKKQRWRQRRARGTSHAANH